MKLSRWILAPVFQKTPRVPWWRQAAATATWAPWSITGAWCQRSVSRDPSRSSSNASTSWRAAWAFPATVSLRAQVFVVVIVLAITSNTADTDISQKQYRLTFSPAFFTLKWNSKLNWGSTAISSTAATNSLRCSAALSPLSAALRSESCGTLCYSAATVKPRPSEIADISICGACPPSVKVSLWVISDHPGSLLLTTPTSPHMHQCHGWFRDSHWLPSDSS